MSRLIDADALALFLVVEGQEHSKKYGFKLGDTIRFSPSQIDEIVRKMPTIEECETGQWVDAIDEDMNPFFQRGWKCTACGMRQTYGRSKYCPNCGARMEIKHEARN